MRTSDARERQDLQLRATARVPRYLEDDAFGTASASGAMFSLDPTDAPTRLRITVSGSRSLYLACGRAALADFLRDIDRPAKPGEPSGFSIGFLRCDGGTLVMERVRASNVAYTNPTTGRQSIRYQANFVHVIEVQPPTSRPRAAESRSAAADRRRYEDGQMFRRGGEDGTILEAIRRAHDLIAAGKPR